MRKELLVLGLSMLGFFCGGNVWAQKTISDYQGLKEAVTEWEGYATQKEELTAQRDTWNKQKTDNEVLLNAANGRKPAEFNYERVETEKPNEVYSAAKAFVDAVTAHYKKTPIDETGKMADISYRIEDLYDEDEEFHTYTLQVSIPSVVGEENGWKKLNAAEVIDVLVNNTSKANYYFTDSNQSNGTKILPDYIVFIYKDGDTVKETVIQAYTGKSKLITSEATSMALSAVLNNSQIIEALITKTVTNEPTKNPAYTDWEREIVEYNAKITEADAELKKIEEQLKAIPTAQTYTLTADISVADTELKEKTWPAGLTLNGDFHRIEGLTPLFNENAGTIENLISEEGSIAKVNNGTADNVFVKTSSNKFRVYSENTGTDYDDVKSAVKANSTVFGYNLDAQKVEKAEAANKLYTATYYSAANQDGTSFDINVKNGGITDGNSLEAYPTENNQFIYVKASDISETIGMQNVVVNGTCQTAKIVEGKDKAEFYIPEDFTAKKLTYDREIKSDMATVCLPFALTVDMREKLNSKWTNEGKQMYYYNYARVDEETNTVWFGLLTNIPANTPGILAFTQGATPGALFQDLNELGVDFEFKSTVGAELAVAATDHNMDREKRFRGNYKPGQSVADIALAAGSMGSNAYGFKDGRLVQLNSQALINQFRSCLIYSKDMAEKASLSGAMLQARFMDENGNEMTGIGNVIADRTDNNDGLKAFGGNGAIEIDAEKDCDVRVYTAGGALVKSLRVEAGHTSLPVSAGIYIVNKNKVVVK